jgi:hypothetical protein
VWCAKYRAVPVAPAPAVATAIAGLSRRHDWVGDDGLVFPGEARSYLDGSASVAVGR